MKKQLFLVVVTGAVGFCLLFGGAAFAAKTKITYWFPGEAGQEEVFAGSAKRFEAKNPDFEVVNTPLPPNSADINTRLNAAKLSNTYPDVFAAFLIYMGTRGSQGEFAPLDNYVAKWNGKSDLLDSALKMGVYKGELLGLGYFPAPVVPVYRKDYFQEAGLDPNKPPKNWQELHEFARKLVKRDNAGNVLRGGIDIPSTTAPDLIYMETLMRANGSKVFDEEKDEPSWTDKGAIEALDYIATLWKEKLSMPHANFQWTEHPFTKGNSAMGWVVNNVLGPLFKNDPSLKQKIGYIPPMGPVRPYTFCGYRLFTIGSDSKVKDAAWKLIEFMMEPEEMWDRYTKLVIPPVRKSLTERFVQVDPVMNKAVVDAVTWGKGKAVLAWTSIGDKYLGQAYEEAINGKKTAEQALKDADRGVRAELKRMGYMK